MLMNRSPQAHLVPRPCTTPDLRKMGEISIVQILVRRQALPRPLSFDEIDLRGDGEGFCHFDLSASGVVPLQGSRIEARSGYGRLV